MPRYLLRIAYDGTDFHGWQKQAPGQRDESIDDDGPAGNGDGETELTIIDALQSPSRARPVVATGPLRTVQGVLEDALREVFRQPILVMGASRTDAGVHARGQAAAFTAESSIPLEKVPAAINSRLPDDVQVRHARIVPPDFDPIRDAVRKTYRYRIEHGCAPGYVPSVFTRRYITRTAYALDPAAMHAAAQHIVGTHDFTSFTRLHHERLSTVRTVMACSVTAESAHRCRIDITGNGFLYNMVRIIAGTLLNVGRGVTAPDDIPRIIAARDRRAPGNGPTLPPHGLCLMRVVYPRGAL